MSNGILREQKHKNDFYGPQHSADCGVQFRHGVFWSGQRGAAQGVWTLEVFQGGERFRLGVVWLDGGTPKLNGLFLELVWRIVGKQTPHLTPHPG